MFTLQNSKVILRDFIASDIPKRLHWETEETEWQLWDAPWEYENMSPEERAAGLQSYRKNMENWVAYYQNLPPEQRRTGFQIVTNDQSQTYIGWINSYRIDAQYCFSNSGDLCAVGIDIPSLSARGKGYAAAALTLFIDYLLNQGEKDIFTQTWSGNVRMIHLAHKIGFEECCVKKEFRAVGNQKYDGLTFRLNQEKYQSFRQCATESSKSFA